MSSKSRVDDGKVSSASQAVMESIDTLPTEKQEFRPRSHDLFFLPIPRRLQYDPANPPQFNLYLNIIFAISITVFLANLFYCQPLLLQLAASFDVTNSEVSRVPILIQSGYATGLFFITPLGDIVRRRQLILLLTFLAAALTIGVAVTRNFVAFEAISFVIGLVSCVPQVITPLTADLAPPEKRAAALSILISGVLLAVLYGRVIAGLIAEFVSWRVAYYVAIGLQFVNIVVLYFVMPDYPLKNTGVSYWEILYTMVKYSVTEPMLIQSYLVNAASMATFSNFWVTLTFLLGESPYNYSTLVIGLFGLVGILGIVVAPLVGRSIDRLVPWLTAVIATVGLLLFQALQTGAGGLNIGVVVIVCFGIDVFRQYQQVSLMNAVYNIEPKARARMNAIMYFTMMVGQIMGSAVGTRVFLNYGWRPAAALSVAWSGFSLALMLIRGPHCSRYTWFGYEGGFDFRLKANPNKSALPPPQPPHTPDGDYQEKE